MPDQKVTELTELTTLSGDEQLYIVDDDDGTPVPRRITIENLAAGLAARSELTGAFDAKSAIDQASVATSETTTSTSYTDLATSGPAVTITVPASGKVEVTITGDIRNSGSSGFSLMSYALSGANTVAAGAADCALINQGTLRRVYSHVQLITGLTPGSTTFTCKYSVDSGTGTFSGRKIKVETKP